MEGTKKIKSTSFHQYSWNSEVETTWISLFGWHHKTSSTYACLLESSEYLFVFWTFCHWFTELHLIYWLSYDCWILILLRGGMYSTVYHRTIILWLSPFFFLLDWVALASTKFCYELSNFQEIRSNM